MARAREETRLLDNPDGNGNTSCTFEPTFETAGDDGLAPPAPSRLRLADELDTYIDRVQVWLVVYDVEAKRVCVSFFFVVLGQQIRRQPLPSDLSMASLVLEHKYYGGFGRRRC